MQTIDIIVAGNNYLLRTGIETLIEGCKDFKFIAEASNDEELLKTVSGKKAQVLIIDLSTITYKTELIALVKKTTPDLQILAINSPQPRQFISKALEQGITSYLLLHCDKDEITEAIYKTAKGERFLCGQIVEVLISGGKKSETHDNNCPLYTYCGGVNVSERELEIIKCVAEGYSNQEIAEKLFISVHTVTTHRKNIMNKLGINNTAGLVMYAVREQLVASN
ncbi:MAG TPA: response regulator transcription factor [Bacteroidia bacterium]|jgi:DNA-binding NarL/FixJ family response regulator|nr:response regulator transcription factor [Bacteroidia bacterium]